MAGATEQPPQVITSAELCQIYALPVILTGLLREILTAHFSSPERIEDEYLRHLIWTDSPDTKILIESSARFDPRTTQRRPAIIIKRRPYANVLVGAFAEKRQLPAATPRGDELFSSFWQGSHVLFCIGTSGIQADLLANEVRKEMHQLRTVIAAEAGLLRFGCAEVGEITALEEWEKHFVVPVTVTYLFEEAWRLRQEAPRLRRIELQNILD